MARRPLPVVPLGFAVTETAAPRESGTVTSVSRVSHWQGDRTPSPVLADEPHGQHTGPSARMSPASQPATRLTLMAGVGGSPNAPRKQNSLHTRSLDLGVYTPGQGRGHPSLTTEFATRTEARTKCYLNFCPQNSARCPQPRAPPAASGDESRLH